MRSSCAKIIVSYLLLILWVAVVASSAAEPKKLKITGAEGASSTTGATTVKSAGYIPPPGKKAAPLKRITVGAPRGAAVNLELTLLVPEDHVFMNSQPSLQWEISTALQLPVKFMLVTDDQTEPTVEKVINHSFTAGQQILNLKDYQVTLMTGKEYQWSMQVCTNNRCDTPARDLSNRTTIYYQP